MSLSCPSQFHYQSTSPAGRALSSACVSLFCVWLSCILDSRTPGMDGVSLNQVMESGALAHVLTSQFRNAKYQDAWAWRGRMSCGTSTKMLYLTLSLFLPYRFVACKQQLKLMQPPPTPLSSNTGENKLHVLPFETCPQAEWNVVSQFNAGFPVRKHKAGFPKPQKVVFGDPPYIS